MKFQHNIARIEALSDAIFAFAATLMVVSFDLSGDFTILKTELSQFLSFGISFFVLIMIWKIHYDFFRRTDYMDNWLIALNSVLLFVVLYFVFPLKSLVGSAFQQKPMGTDEASHIFIMYGMGFVLLFLCVSLMYLRAYKKFKTPEKQIVLLAKAGHFGTFAIVGIISVLFSALEIGIQNGVPGFIYFLIGPLSYFNAMWFKKKFRRVN